MVRSRSGTSRAPRAQLIAPDPVIPGSWRITARHRRQETDFANPEDFRRGPEAVFAGGSLYTLDPLSGEAWLVDVPYAALAGAPFAYAVQADRARVIARRDADDLPLPDRAVYGLFSIGRCGSTLLSRILQSAGASVVNELDAFTALGQIARRWPADDAVQDRLTDLARGAIGHVARYGPGGPLLLKLRSQAMQAGRALCRGGMRPILLVRQFDDWVRSNAYHFPDDPLEGRIDAMARGLSELAALPTPPAPMDYARMLSDPVAAATACIGPVSQNRYAAIRACLDEHSQRGTALSRPPAAIGEETIARARDLWTRHADPVVLNRLGLTEDLTLLTEDA